MNDWMTVDGGGDVLMRADVDGVVAYATPRAATPGRPAGYRLEVRVRSDADGPKVTLSVEWVPAALLDTVAFEAQSVACTLHCAERYADHGWTGPR